MQVFLGGLMHKHMFTLVLAAFLALATLPAAARGHRGGYIHHASFHRYVPHTSFRSGGHAYRSRSHYGSYVHYSRHPNTRRASGVRRDRHGRIARSGEAKWRFRRSHPCPSTGRSRGACPGYVIDHVRALKHGGADDPSNMQWQTKAAAKAKDRWE